MSVCSRPHLCTWQLRQQWDFGHPMLLRMSSYAAVLTDAAEQTKRHLLTRCAGQVAPEYAVQALATQCTGHFAHRRHCWGFCLCCYTQCSHLRGGVKVSAGQGNADSLGR